MAFGQVGEKNYGKDCANNTIQMVQTWYINVYHYMSNIKMIKTFVNKLLFK